MTIVISKRWAALAATIAGAGVLAASALSSPRAANAQQESKTQDFNVQVVREHSLAPTDGTIRRIPKGWRLAATSVSNIGQFQYTYLWFRDSDGAVYRVTGSAGEKGTFVVLPTVDKFETVQ